MVSTWQADSPPPQSTNNKAKQQVSSKQCVHAKEDREREGGGGVGMVFLCCAQRHVSAKAALFHHAHEPSPPPKKKVEIQPAACRRTFSAIWTGGTTSTPMSCSSFSSWSVTKLPASLLRRTPVHTNRKREGVCLRRCTHAKLVQRAQGHHTWREPRTRLYVDFSFVIVPCKPLFLPITMHTRTRARVRTRTRTHASFQ